MDDSLILGRYRPLEKAGAGAFGTVQVAWDTTIQRKVAIKCIRLSAADAYALVSDGARDAGAVSHVSGPRHAIGGAGAAFANEDEASAFGDAAIAQMAGDLDDGYGEADAEGGWDEFAETGGDGASRQERRGLTHWFARTFGTGTEKLPDNRTGAERGRGVVPIGGDDEPGKLSEHWLADLPGLDEARTAALLSDAHIVAVYDFQVVGRMAYLIMEYVEGMTLTRFLRDHDDDLSLDIIAAIFSDVAHALTAAHASGVLHLDIKPDNVLIDKRGQVKVTDFGLATLADEMGYGLAGGGTIGYMPPEQMHQEQLDARTDEWALASITYEMLTGKNPFVSADNLDDALDLIDSAELVLPSLCWRGLDARIDDVVFQALDPDRTGRYDAVSQFADALEPYLGNVDAGHQALAAIVGGAEAGALLETAAPGIFAPAAPAASGSGGALKARAEDRDILDVEAIVRDPEDVLREYTERMEAAAAAASGAEQGGKRTTASRAGGHFFGIWSRIIGFFFSGGVMLLACLNVPLFSTFQEPFITELLQHIWPAALGIPELQNSFLWALVVVCAVLAAIKPTWGTVMALAGFGVAMVWRGNVWLGLAFFLIAGLWWYTTGRHGGSQANCGLAYLVFGSFGAAPFATLATGIGMRVLDAAMTALFGIFACLICASLGSGDIMNWHLGTYWNFAADDVAAGFGITVASIRNWVIAASWLIAAAVGGLCTMPRQRWINIVGTVAASAIVIGGLFLGTWLGSGQVSWVPGAAELVKTLIACVVAIVAACLFVPEPYKKKGKR